MLKIQVFTRPNLLNDHEKRFIKEIEEVFSLHIEKCSQTITPFIKDIFYYIIVGYELIGINKDNQYDDKRKRLVYLNMPDKITSEQDIKLSTFRGCVDIFVRDLKVPDDFSAKQIVFIFSFNKEPQELLKSLAQKAKDSKNEEGLNFFVPVLPKFRLDQIVLNKDLIDEISKTLSTLKYRHVLYDEWGFSEIEPAPKAIMNFYGPSGTGKTMTAHAIANQIGLKILALNYADIESKFVGDAPKNLVRAFETAEQENALLFFDEADSFLGKRITSVSTSSDQAVNSLRSQMLIQLENFTGIVIFATNLLTNYDRAFESRIFKHLKFDLPDKENRIKLIKKMIPTRVPIETLTEEQFAELADISDGFSGRDIKNCILNALTTVLHEERESVVFNDLQNSFKQYSENKKNLDKEFKSGKLDPDKKKELEVKIMNNLKKEKSEGDDEFNRTLLEIGLHAILIDGIAQKQERELFDKITKGLHIELEIPKDNKELPPISDLVAKLNSKQEKIAAVDFIIHLITADGHCSKQEVDFAMDFFGLLNIQSDIKDDLIIVMNELGTAQARWIKDKENLERQL